MTNEEFLGHLEDEIVAMGVNPERIANNRLFRHAKKLVAIMEASEDVAANPHNNFDKILILRGKLQDLKRE